MSCEQIRDDTISTPQLPLQAEVLEQLFSVLAISVERGALQHACQKVHRHHGDADFVQRVHAVFNETGEENIDGVFLGFDSKNKIISWFD